MDLQTALCPPPPRCKRTYADAVKVIRSAQKERMSSSKDDSWTEHTACSAPAQMEWTNALAFGAPSSRNCSTSNSIEENDISGCMSSNHSNVPFVRDTMRPFICEEFLRGICLKQNDAKKCRYLHLEAPVWNSFDHDFAICSKISNENPLAARNYLWQFSVGEVNSSSQVGSSSTGDGWLDFSVCDSESLEQSFADPAKMSWSRVVDNTYVCFI